MTAWLGVSPDMCEIEWDAVCACTCQMCVNRGNNECVCWRTDEGCMLQ